METDEQQSITGKAKVVAQSLLADVKGGNRDVILGLVAIVLAVLSGIGVSSSPIYNTILLAGPALTGYVFAKALAVPEGRKLLVIAAISGVIFLLCCYHYGEGMANLVKFGESMKNMEQMMNGFKG